MRGNDNYLRIEDGLRQRILVLDGAMGTEIQKYRLSEADYKGSKFRGNPNNLKGCHDVLCLSRPDIISEIHRRYLEAGADIISTNSFNSNAISLADYGLEGYSEELSRTAARIARGVADEFTALTPDKPRFVAGSIGPTNKSASISADITNPGAREITFDQLRQAYTTQIEGLIEGGVDALLIETVFDTLNAKAAIYAAEEVSQRIGRQIPLMLSATVSDAGGRTLSGQTIEALICAVSHARLLSIGLNCSFGPEKMGPHLRTLSRATALPVSCHPNAGLPDESGEYDLTPGDFGRMMNNYMAEGLLNIVGGCCGTTPAHIAELARLAAAHSPRQSQKLPTQLKICGLETLTFDGTANFINIGERANVAGSARFARLIREENYEEALSVVRNQIEAGARIVDVCMDHPMIDAPKAMTTFLNLMASDPEIARVPVMIDSSDPNVIRAGLEVAQGKCIVNSISLKEGEEIFLERARELRRFGAAAVVMLFDENGQADTFERKIEVAQRSYNLLTEAGFPATDIIFDPNILTIGTGIEGHDRYAVNFIEAVKWIKSNLPGARVSGGVSNLSFAFRGNNALREAIHSVFLYHAISAGLDMAIVNAGVIPPYTDIEPELLQLVEDLVLARRKDATERLTAYATNVGIESLSHTEQSSCIDQLSLRERIERALLKGISETLDADIDEALSETGSGLAVIENILMPAMSKIGTLFGEGKMFLPQVLKSARVLRQAIDRLSPSIKKDGDNGLRGKVVVATVRGDIHDIGKNIVSLVAGCNGFEVVDLGVMVPPESIADAAERLRPVAVLLSGLITPSLAEMIEVCREMERRGLRIPVIVGGATTSALHTALKIAPEYSGPVFHSSDASQNSRLLAQLAGSESVSVIIENRQAQAKMREDYTAAADSTPLLSLEQARRMAQKATSPSLAEAETGIKVIGNFPIHHLTDDIEWSHFFAAWGLKGKFPEIFDNSAYGLEARRLYEDAEKMLSEISERQVLRLQAVIGTFPARREGENIIVESERGTRVLPMLRSQTNGKCAADYLAESGDHIVVFALSAGIGLKEMTRYYRSKGDDYHAVLAKLLADRLTEAFAVKINVQYPGCRLAFGYPAVPDHTLKRDIFELLDAEERTEMRLGDNCMIQPEESICGIIIKNAEYFTLGRIDESQLKKYAEIRGLNEETLRKHLPYYLIQSK